jgi:hypothetical protein
MGHFVAGPGLRPPKGTRLWLIRPVATAAYLRTAGPHVCVYFDIIPPGQVADAVTPQRMLDAIHGRRPYRRRPADPVHAAAAPPP